MGEIGAIYTRMGGISGDFSAFIKRVKTLSRKIGAKEDRVIASIGSLGGGNHFISVNQTKDGGAYLIVHSGSRNLGKMVAEYHQEKARRSASKESIEREIEKIKKESSNGREIGERIKAYREAVAQRQKPRDLEWLEEDDREEYFEDMKTAHIYARLNRRVMISRLQKALNQRALNEKSAIESVHNYVDFDDNIIRKGAIRAHSGELCLIPLNMADGILLCKGKGAIEYNQSAPHGAGRIMSRSQAKARVKLSDYEERMKRAGVWSSCVDAATLDESPQAYKDADLIKNAIGDTVEIIDQMREVYNFKASE
jgi:RNA-splicing ligase RtcB